LFLVSKKTEITEKVKQEEEEEKRWKRKKETRKILKETKDSDVCNNSFSTTRKRVLNVFNHFFFYSVNKTYHLENMQFIVY
jgi:hypothetical protein